MNIKQIEKEAIKYYLKWLKTNYKDPIIDINFIEQFKTQPNSKVAADYKTGRIYILDINNNEYEEIITWLQIQSLKHEEERAVIEKISENYIRIYMNNMKQAVEWLSEDAPKEILKKHETRINEVIKFLNIMR